VEELDFLEVYDKAKQAIQEIVDLPDRQIDLFINLTIQNNGKLSERKRESFFSKLNSQEIDAIEDAIWKAFNKNKAG